MFYKKVVDGELSGDILLFHLAEKFHWTLDYIESLPLERISTLQGIEDGINRYQTDMRDKGHT